MIRDFGDEWRVKRWDAKITYFPTRKQKFLGKPLTTKEIIDYKKNGYVEIRDNIHVFTFTKEMMVIEENEGVQTKMRFGSVDVITIPTKKYFINGSDEQYEVCCAQYCKDSEFLGNVGNFNDEKFYKKFLAHKHQPYPQFFGERTDNGKLVHFNGNDVNKVFKSKEDYEKHIKKNVDHYKKIGILRGEEKPIDGMLGEISWPEFESTTENIKLKPIHSKRRMAKISTQL